MQKIFISSSVSQYPSHASAGGYLKAGKSEKVIKIAELQAKLCLAVLDNQALRGKYKELNDKLCHIKEQLKEQYGGKHIEKPAKRISKHKRNLSQPDMGIEKQLSNPTLKCSQAGKRDIYDMVKMQRQELSICEEKVTLKVISSKNPPLQSNTIKSIPTNKENYVTPKDIQRVPKRRSNCSNLGLFAFETVEEIWASTKICKPPSHKRSYLKQ